ncbi:MAG: Crp/Fnr family transcriptional regulator [Thermodesulfobacteriota bacterium]
MGLVDLIAAVPLFEGLSPAQHRDLASISREQSYDRGEVIFAEGDKAEGLYVVSDGRVKIYKLSPEGKEQILHIFGPGEPIGEVAVFAGRGFPAYAEALEKSAALIFPRPALIDLIRRNPDLALSLIGVLSLRLRRFANLIEDLSLKEVPGRLAAYLLILSQRAGGADEIELDITKGQLAALLGTIPETLSRILARMVRQELIELAGRKIRIMDREALEDLAGAQTRLWTD